MDEKPPVIAAAGGALSLSALALAMGVCCVAPWAVTLLGISGAVLLARLAYLQPYLAAATLVLIGLGMWFAYRPQPADAICDVARQRRLRWLMWTATLIAVAMGIASFAPRFIY